MASMDCARRIVCNVTASHAALAETEQALACRREGNFPEALSLAADLAERIGERAKAADFLRSKGFKKVQNLTGGIISWIDQVDPSQPKY